MDDEMKAKEGDESAANTSVDETSAPREETRRGRRAKRRFLRRRRSPSS